MGRDESNEGESHEGRWSHDRVRREQQPRREERFEGEAGQGHRRWADGSCSLRAEEERRIQDWWLREHEVEEEASNPGSQGSEPLHQGALRFQGKASVQDRARLGNEEVEGDGELKSCFVEDEFLSILVGGRTGLT